MLKSRLGLNATFCFTSMILCAVSCYPSAAAQIDHGLVFRLGIFDRSSAEFAEDIPTHPVEFIVGKSDPTKDWYRKQPALAKSTRETSVAAAPRSITFSLTHLPGAVYRLHVALLIDSPCVPALQVDINGRRGTFYLEPELDTSGGPPVASADPIYSHADVVFAFPGTYLHKGVNTITLQATGDADDLVPNAGFAYDAIELDRNLKLEHVPDFSARIVPTVFYQRRDGRIEEVLDVFFRYSEQVKPGSSMNLVLARKTYRQPLHDEKDFGEEKLELLVQEFPPQSRAHLVWNIGGQKRESDQIISPKKKWTLLLVPHIHLDVGFTDHRAKVAVIQSRVIDEAIDLIKQYPDFRFSLDGEWTLAQFMKTRTAAGQQRAITAIQERQLFVPAQYANLLTGFPTAETLIRSLYPSAGFSQRYRSPFDYANITDVPSYSWSYASVLASAGIRYFLAGSDNIRGPVLLQGHLNEKSPFWWEGPDGQKVLFWYSRMYGQMYYLFGVPPKLAAGHDTLPLFLQTYEGAAYRANDVILFGTQGENSDLFRQQAILAHRWNAVYAYPRLQYAGVVDALKNIQRQFGDDIPTIRGDGGPYWEDGIASDGRYAAVERKNEVRALSAEKLVTLASLVDPQIKVDKSYLDRMWRNMILMDEHTWGSAYDISDPTSMQAVKQLEVKRAFATDAGAQVDSVARSGMASIANSIAASSGSLIVFNTLNWKRSGLVTIDLEKADEILDASTEQVIPFEIIRSSQSFHRVRLIVPDVPAVGYKVLTLRRAQKSAPPIATERATVLESPYYRVTLDPATGAVRSIYDKQLKHELVNQQSPFRFGQYLYVTGGASEPNSILEYSSAAPRANLEIHASHDGRVVSVTKTPYGWIARMESTDTNTPKIATEIRLYDQAKKIEFIEDLDKTKVYSKEGVYFAFPFAMNHPRFQYEIQNGVVDPANNMYPGAGHEWFSVQHWVSVEQDGLAGTVMPLDASLVTLGDINRGAWPTQFGKRTGTIFSYMMNNYWFTNYRAGQGGHFRFRYVVTSAPATDAVDLSRRGWEEATPLEVDAVTSRDNAFGGPHPLSGKQQSLLNLHDSTLFFDTWKPAEDGNGTILRFLDLGGTTRTVNVESQLLHLSQVWQTSAVEKNEKSLMLLGTDGFKFTIHPHEIVTVRAVTHETSR